MRLSLPFPKLTRLQLAVPFTCDTSSVLPALMRDCIRFPLMSRLDCTVFHPVSVSSPFVLSLCPVIPLTILFKTYQYCIVSFRYSWTMAFVPSFNSTVSLSHTKKPTKALTKQLLFYFPIGCGCTPICSFFVSTDAYNGGVCQCILLRVMCILYDLSLHHHATAYTWMYRGTGRPYGYMLSIHTVCSRHLPGTQY